MSQAWSNELRRVNIIQCWHLKQKRTCPLVLVSEALGDTGRKWTKDQTVDIWRLGQAARLATKARAGPIATGRLVLLTLPSCSQLSRYYILAYCWDACRCADLCASSTGGQGGAESHEIIQR